MTKEITFFGEQKVKDALLERAINHRKADEYIRGTYVGSDFTFYTDYYFKGGCSVGCLAYDTGEKIKKDIGGGVLTHQKIEREFGVPNWMLRNSEYVFEGWAGNKYEADPYWTEMFVDAIPVGVHIPQLGPDHMSGDQLLDYLRSFKEPDKIEVISEVKELVSA